MISLSTAKLFLFIALLVGPKFAGSDHSIEIVNKNSYCVWTQDATGWTLTQLGQTTNHWPENGTNISDREFARARNNADNADFVVASEVTRHNWNASQNSNLHLSNGDIIEKKGNQVFYTTNAGAPNQDIYTILTIKNGETLQ